MTNALIISTGYDPEYLRIIEQIAIEIMLKGQRPVVFDLAPIMTSPTESYSTTILKLGRIKSSAELFIKGFKELNIEVYQATDYIDHGLQLDEEAVTELNESKLSALLTYFRTDKLNFQHRRVSKTADLLIREGSDSFRALTQFLSKNSYIDSYLPNGRFPVQRLAKLALSRAGIPVNHFEKGATADHAYLRPYSPHDRIATQADVKNLLKGVHLQEVEEIADSWLNSRLPSNSSRNEYAAIWNGSVPSIDGKSSRAKIGFFTSSQDEFLNLGKEWQLHSWTSQFQAFDLLLSHFESMGYECYLRVHPNLSTKEHNCFKREIVGLKQLAQKHPDLVVYWHDDSTSSYSLLEQSAGVVVWDSTIGLEASARGIPVWNCAASYYGLTADIKTVLGREEISESKLTPWTVDGHKAKQFITYFVKRDIALSTKAAKWADWDLNSPPFWVKIASLARSGGAPTFIDSVLVSIDPWRHRGMRANAQLLKAKTFRWRNRK